MGTEKSSAGEIKVETNGIEKDEEAKDLTEKSSKGETIQKTPESSEQFFSKDQDTTEKSLEGKIKDKTKDIENFHVETKEVSFSKWVSNEVETIADDLTRALMGGSLGKESSSETESTS